MHLAKKIERAHRILNVLNEADRNAVQRLCECIKDAQATLVANAAPLFNHCITKCKGLCCRNINMDNIITLMDLVFILSVTALGRSRLQQLAAAESIFPADCLFLRYEKGPCLFPENAKPERCVLTFCADTDMVVREMRAVKSGFSTLFRYVLKRKPWLVFGF